MPGKREFKHMYQEHVTSIYRFLFWRTGDEPLAEDLTSEVFTKAWQSWETFDGKYVKAWLHRIAQNTLTDHWRKKQTLPLDDDFAETLESGEKSTAEVLDSKFDASRLKKALETLPDTVKEVIILRFMEGLSSKETAERLGLGEANVRVLQHRALKQLRKWYEKQ